MSRRRTYQLMAAATALGALGAAMVVAGLLLEESPDAWRVLWQSLVAIGAAITSAWCLREARRC